MKDDREIEEAIANGIQVVRVGHGANCSSVGSVIDTLFASAVVGGAIFAAIAAAMAREEIRVVSPHRNTAEKSGEQATDSDDGDTP